MIKYHGTPLTPRSELLRMAGRCFCVPFPNPGDAETCLQIGSSVMFDNGAFSAFTRGVPFDEAGFYAWVAPMLGHPHWAVIPDVIGGSVEQQRELVGRWPFLKELGAPVWHLSEPLDYLLELADAWPRICFGSTAEYWDIGTPAWCARMDAAFNALARSRRHLPWIHGLRMLNLAGSEYPLASADSVNVARNFKDEPRKCPDAMAGRIDVRNNPVAWKQRAQQMEIL